MRTNTRELLIEKYIPPTRINEYGTCFWKNKNGQLHSFNGQPSAVFYFNNIGRFFCNGIIKRRVWHKNGEHIKEKWY